MKTIPIFQVDAFTHGPFTGNPAAVCVLTDPVTEDTMQKIAMENNLSETAFITRGKDEWLIRWFTPAAEVDLCGHATLASAFVVLNLLEPQSEKVIFRSRVMGHLIVRRKNNLLELDFPVDNPAKCVLPQFISESLGGAPMESYMGRSDYMLVYGSESEIRQMKPDFRGLSQTESRGVIVTAPGDSVDFVSRFFCPQIGIDEDPVTGSAHTTLTPYWSGRLGKKHLEAQQLSSRGGLLLCTLDGDRVHIAGSALLYLKGEIFV
ncbi:MAG: PhzF family phenazine biosynthesis protein [Bacteroidales bacterium]|jgi:PhzF family phenazine biosynthesis protein|nr:PhzF family phenazine biosynthesis protein [Bacteroidales bacterium]